MALEYQVNPKHLRLAIEQWCMFWKKIDKSARSHNIDWNIHAWGDKITFPSWKTQRRTTIWETFITLTGRRKKEDGKCFLLWWQKSSLLVAFTPLWSGIQHIWDWGTEVCQRGECLKSSVKNKSWWWNQWYKLQETRELYDFVHLGILGAPVCVCLTLCDPVDCSPPGSSVHGILQARTLEYVASPGGLPDSGMEPASSALAGGFFTTTPSGKPSMHTEETYQRYRVNEIMNSM